jgi:hydroxysqualene dehydroxylase
VGHPASVAVVGAGWSGMAAAVEATLAGSSVTLFEMAAQCGGRARSVEIDGVGLDNGQHIMIGAYRELLRLMRVVGADPSELLLRTPLQLRNASGSGLALRPGHALIALAQAVATHPTWPLRAKLALAAQAGRWALARFNCEASLNVAALTARLPALIRHDLIDPLCVAALNTPSRDASASVFLRVLRDALFSNTGASDLLLPRVGLSDVFPTPALQWLRARGATVRASTRVESIQSHTNGWSVQGRRFDSVVLAASPVEAARLAKPHARDWSRVARSLPFEPIVTVYLRCAGARLPLPMLALDSSATAPAQFVFDRGQLGGAEGLLAFVISGARDWVEQGAVAAAQACIAQAKRALADCASGPFETVQVLTEKRATFRCVAQLERPPMRIAAGLNAAGDYVAGPYPATLEGAVRSGVNAARDLA